MDKRIGQRVDPRFRRHLYFALAFLQESLLQQFDDGRHIESNRFNFGA